MDFNWLTLSCFKIFRGIKLKTQNSEYKYSWKVHILLYIHLFKNLNFLYKQTSNQVIQIDKTKFNYKKLPEIENLINIYFKNPGFKLAHLHMQDVSAHYLNENIKTIRFHIQTTNKKNCNVLAYVIYKIIKFKFIVFYYKFKNKDRYHLLLCPDNITLFQKLTKPYILSYFDYKMPIFIKNINNKEVIERYNIQFNIFYK